MTEALPLTDTELRLKEIEAKWKTRREEAERTGKPVPPHIVRWYEKQIAEARAAMQRVLSSLLPKEDLQAHIIARITAVKHQQDAKLAASEGKAKKAEPAAPKPAKPEVKTAEQRRIEKNARRRKKYAEDDQYAERSASRSRIRDAEIRRRKQEDPVFREQHLQKEREYRRRYLEKLQTDAAHRQKVLETRELQMNLKLAFHQLYSAHEEALLRIKNGVPSAKDLVAEAAVAEAIESGTMSEEEQAVHLQHIRATASVVDEKNKLTKNQKTAIRRTERRRAQKERELLDQTVEVGWAKKAIERDPELRQMFEETVEASVRASICNFELGGLTMSDEVKAMKREEFTQKWLMRLDANHNLLHERRAHRNASTLRSQKKKWDELRADPERYAAYKEERRLRYHHDKAKES